MTKHRFVLYAAMSTAFSLGMLLPLLGLLAPRPGAPLNRRSLGIGDFWLVRIVETATPSGASWLMETNWLSILVCAIGSGVMISYLWTRRFGDSQLGGGGNRSWIAK